MTVPFLSICIPSHNRLKQLGELLTSIDCSQTDIEIVICEDLAPKRLEVRAIANAFAQASTYPSHYHENTINRGFHRNLRRLVECAGSEYIMFMGDDDMFVPGVVVQFSEFLKGTSKN